LPSIPLVLCRSLSFFTKPLPSNSWLCANFIWALELLSVMIDPSENLLEVACTLDLSEVPLLVSCKGLGNTELRTNSHLQTLQKEPYLRKCNHKHEHEKWRDVKLENKCVREFMWGNSCLRFLHQPLLPRCSIL
jgi:hypothetical protein